MAGRNERAEKKCLRAGLTEEIKWGKPCYTFYTKNIVLIQGFKEYCALLFLQGYLLDDPVKFWLKPEKIQ